jgi:hypothetical protein
MSNRRVANAPLANPQPAEDAAKDQKPAAELDKVVRWKPPPPGAAPQQVRPPIP